MRALSFLGFIFAATLLIAQQPPAPITPPVPPPPPVPATPEPVPNAPAEEEEEETAEMAKPPGGETRVNEFQGDDTGLVFRTLARQAQASVVISDRVAKESGTVTMRLENKSPQEAIEIIAQSKGLILDELNGVYFIRTATEVAKESAPRALERVTRELVHPLAQLKGKYYKELIKQGVPAETASEIVRHEELSKGVFAASSRAPVSAETQASRWFGGLGSTERESLLTAGGVATAVFTSIPGVLLHFAFAIAVWCAACRVEDKGESLTFFGPYLWTLATLVGGVLVAGLYWLMHHSTLRRAPDE